MTPYAENLLARQTPPRLPRPRPSSPRPSEPKSQPTPTPLVPASATPPQLPPPPARLSIRLASKLAGASRDSIYRLYRAGFLRGVQISPKKILIDADDLRAFTQASASKDYWTDERREQYRRALAPGKPAGTYTGRTTLDPLPGVEARTFGAGRFLTTLDPEVTALLRTYAATHPQDHLPDVVNASVLYMIGEVEELEGESYRKHVQYAQTLRLAGGQREYAPAPLYSLNAAAPEPVKHGGHGGERQSQPVPIGDLVRDVIAGWRIEAAETPGIAGETLARCETLLRCADALEAALGGDTRESCSMDDLSAD